MLKAYGDATGRVWVADSFEGLPPPDAARYPRRRAATAAHESTSSPSRSSRSRRTSSATACSTSRSGSSTGWFRDTLPTAPIERLAVLRLDGDMYESTIEALERALPEALAGRLRDRRRLRGDPELPPGDRRLPGRHGIDEEIHQVDWTGVYWQRRQ